MARILIVDDRVETRQSLGALLEAEGYSVRVTSDITAAVTAVRASPLDLVLADVRLDGDDDGLKLLRLLKGEFPRLPVILYTGFARIGEAVLAMKLGASDYLEFPLDPAEIVLAVEHTMHNGRPRVALEVRPPSARPPHDIVAVSPAMRAVLEWTERIAPTDFPVVLMGETGTGKELLAHAIHSMSDRRTAPFVPINCSAIPEGLCEAELFGYRRGAFTGALGDKPGLFEEAHGGTLFLDEVVELLPSLQPRLLRFLENGEVRRLGDTRIRHINARVIAAGNRPLREEVAHGRFRSDLFFRLNRIACRIPPLREHLDDLEPLIQFWLPRLTKGLTSARAISASGLALLRTHSWPGNIRELRNVLEHAVSLGSGDLITEEDVASALGAAVLEQTDVPGAITTREERDRLLVALAKHRWKPGHAAASLGISRATLWRRLRKHGIKRVYEKG
ncbi:MAG: sigma-54-dependent transcriptional regulator [Vicinamibacterales bacterium]